MRVLRAAGRVATPWKNGGGVTREIAVWPPGAGFDDFDWRVSMAEVRSDGPFSVFPGVDRILAVLRGALVLDIQGHARVELGPDAPPARFPGDAPTHGRVPAGHVVDLNIMTRRGRGHAMLERVGVRPRLVLPSLAGTRLLLACAPLQAQGAALGIYDAALFVDGQEVALEAARGADVYIATFQA